MKCTAILNFFSFCWNCVTCVYPNWNWCISSFIISLPRKEERLDKLMVWAFLKIIVGYFAENICHILLKQITHIQLHVENDQHYPVSLHSYTENCRGLEITQEFKALLVEYMLISQYVDLKDRRKARCCFIVPLVSTLLHPGGGTVKVWHYFQMFWELSLLFSGM